MKIELAATDAEILACFPVLVQLRPHLREATFVTEVRRLEREGFRLASLRDPDVVAVAGFRVMELFATGKILYVDDLVTDEARRSQGHGETLLAWLRAEAGRLGCKFLELDSGSDRLAAHRFYRRHGLEPVALHFSIPVDGGAKWKKG